jgi:hypothetical protein
VALRLPSGLIPYSTLNYPNRHRIQMGYDPVKNWVRISQPLRRPAASTDAPEFLVWIYDLNSDRVWLDSYTANPTCWGNVNVVSAAATTWATITTTWATETRTWGELTGATFGLETVVHGTDTAQVMEHDPNLITKAGEEPTFSYPSAVIDLGNSRTLKTANRLRMEYINVLNDGNVSLSVSDGRGNTSSSQDGMDQSVVAGDAEGDIETADGWHRLTNERLGFTASGSGPVLIRGFELEYFDEGSERYR